ncbi:hypothetical protein [Hymenobacter radiodurans]|uniref:hypothetical protein n=1 Tax=Hymenobacter radiodurans TaxID=2496028 RepID=UPI001058EE95|nr:hypothetical protein [Hymenobacter radiodurans]
MRSETDVAYNQRYLIIRDRLGEFPPAYSHFKKYLTSPRWASVTTDYCYADIDLPKFYDYIFELNNPNRYWQQRTVVRHAFLYHHKINRLEHGHAMHCLIEFPDNDAPLIFSELPINDGGVTMHSGIGLCTAGDWEYIHHNLTH